MKKYLKLIWNVDSMIVLFLFYLKICYKISDIHLYVRLIFEIIDLFIVIRSKLRTANILKYLIQCRHIFHLKMWNLKLNSYFSNKIILI